MVKVLFCSAWMFIKETVCYVLLGNSAGRGLVQKRTPSLISAELESTDLTGQWSWRACTPETFFRIQNTLLPQHKAEDEFTDCMIIQMVATSCHISVNSSSALCPFFPSMSHFLSLLAFFVVVVVGWFAFPRFRLLVVLHIFVNFPPFFHAYQSRQGKKI